MPLRGDFGLTRGRGWKMAVVRYGTLSRFGHACLAVGDAVDGWVQIVEAMPDGVRTRAARVEEWTWSDIPLTDAQRDAGAAAGLAEVGERYDWPAIGGFVLRWFLANLRGGSKDHEDDNDMCSELVDWIWRDHMHLDPKPGFAPNTVSPGDLGRYRDRYHATH